MIITLITRIFQLIFSVIVLGISIDLIKGQFLGGSPSIQNFDAFVGGWGLLASIVGFVGLFVTAVGGTFVPLVFDALAAVFSLAAGIAMAVKLGAHSCSDQVYTTSNPLINGGNTGRDSTGHFFYGTDHLKSRCHENGAVTAFEFFMFVAFAAGAALAGMAMRRGGGKGSAV